ncbi:Zinc metalloproteinase [Mycena indigotica]|uniref:Zinc metalloproteinase n=1 Tax=Mycena indigotica TaxID=2126181 RepID=A0A8H6SAA7_9AGAR|nr:Zinc metalloproteinase [Mycena indigotica]KAF7295016.1 Zinc metalloproteinase [Mycena indigotica]
MADASMSLVISYRGTQHRVALLPDNTLSDLHQTLEELTTVPPEMQKLLYKNSPKGGGAPEMSLREAGLKDGSKIQMVGSTLEELGGLHAKEAEARKRDRILRERALKAPVKVRSTGSATASDHMYRFHKIAPLPHLPNPESAMTVLQRMANDKAIQHVMRQHQFSVGMLTELDPRERPDLLGLNQNHGQEIKVRIRTDSYDGFRPYFDVRRTLCHELAHNVHGPHDENFKRLNSQLNREVAEFERAAKEGTHRLYGGDIYEADDAENLALSSHVLGGTSSGSTELDTVDDRRRRVLEAAMGRLKKQEEELEQSCGTAGPAAK